MYFFLSSSYLLFILQHACTAYFGILVYTVNSPTLRHGSTVREGNSLDRGTDADAGSPLPRAAALREEVQDVMQPFIVIMILSLVLMFALHLYRIWILFGLWCGKSTALCWSGERKQESGLNIADLHASSYYLGAWLTCGC